MAKLGFEGFNEENLDIPNAGKSKGGFEGMDETGLDKPSTQGSGSNSAKKPTTSGPDSDGDGD